MQWLPGVALEWVTFKCAGSTAAPLSLTIAQTNAAFRAAKAAGQTPLEYATAFAAKCGVNEAIGPIRNLEATGKGAPFAGRKVEH